MSQSSGMVAVGARGKYCRPTPMPDASAAVTKLCSAVVTAVHLSSTVMEAERSSMMYRSSGTSTPGLDSAAQVGMHRPPISL